LSDVDGGVGSPGRVTLPAGDSSVVRQAADERTRHVSCAPKLSNRNEVALERLYEADSRASGGGRLRKARGLQVYPRTPSRELDSEWRPQSMRRVRTSSGERQLSQRGHHREHRVDHDDADDAHHRVALVLGHIGPSRVTEQSRHWRSVSCGPSHAPNQAVETARLVWRADGRPPLKSS